MTEGSSNSDLDLNEITLNLIQCQNTCIKLKNDFMEERERARLLEEKNNYFENEIKVMKEKTEKKIQKINYEHENEIEEIKQSLQQIQENTEQLIKSFELKFKTKDNEISSFNQIINQKDEKINSLEEKFKEVNNSFDKKICELTNDLKRLNNTKRVHYWPKENEWSRILDYTGIHDFRYVDGNGYFKLINGGNITGKSSTIACIISKNHFSDPKRYFYSLFYFEIKYMKYAHVEFGLSKWIYYGKEERRKYVEFPRYEDVFNNNDIYGCGLVFPPTNKSEKSPYIFFTKNGKKVDRTYFGDYDGFEPFIRLGCCSVEANFGTKPFIYDVNNHYALKQYSDKDYTRK